MFPVTVTIHNHEQLSQVLAAMQGHHVPKSAAVSDVSGSAIAKAAAALTKTAAESDHIAVSAGVKSQVSTVVEAKKSKGESVPAPAPSAEQPAVATTGTADFGTVRALVLKLAPTNRDAIKALNAKHGINKLSDLLTVPDDFNSEVNDQVKLAAIYADLQALGA